MTKSRKRTVTLVAAIGLTVALSGCVPIWLVPGPNGVGAAGVSQASYDVNPTTTNGIQFTPALEIRVYNCSNIQGSTDYRPDINVAAAPIARVKDVNGNIVFDNYDFYPAIPTIPTGTQMQTSDPSTIIFPTNLNAGPFTVDFAGCSNAAGGASAQAGHISWVMTGCVTNANHACPLVQGGYLDMWPQ